MSTYGLYVGNASDPNFQWDSDTEILLPETVLNLGLYDGVHHFCEVSDVLKHPDFGGKPLDWGSWGALVDKEGIRRFLLCFPQYKDWMQHNLRKINGLPDEGRYVIVAYEY
jgi:hypothetical protein